MTQSQEHKSQMLTVWCHMILGSTQNQGKGPSLAKYWRTGHTAQGLGYTTLGENLRFAHFRSLYELVGVSVAEASDTVYCYCHLTSLCHTQHLTVFLAIYERLPPTLGEGLLNQKAPQIYPTRKAFPHHTTPHHTQSNQQCTSSPSSPRPLPWQPPLSHR